MEITAFQFCFTTSSTANSIDKCRRKLFVARGSYTSSKRIRYIIEALGSSQSEGAGNCSEGSSIRRETAIYLINTKAIKNAISIVKKKILVETKYVASNFITAGNLCSFY